MRLLAPVLVSAALLAAGGCASRPANPTPSSASEPTVASIHLVRHGGHTGIVLRRADVPPGLWPERRDFPDAEHLEVGWGDHDFYRTPTPTPWMVFKAVFLPTASVLHVVGFRGAVAAYFRANEVIEIALPRSGIEGLVRYIHDAHLRQGTEAATPLGPGNYGDSRFYAGREAFHLFRTCNVWTAGALRAAGLPVRDAIIAEELMAQARTLGQDLRAGAP